MLGLRIILTAGWWQDAVAFEHTPLQTFGVTRKYDELTNRLASSPHPNR